MAISTMYSAKAGSPKTVLASMISASSTQMTVADPSVLPSAPNLAVLGSDSSAEIVSYSAKNGNVLSGLVRGIGGTTASVWDADTIVARNFTSFDHDRFKYNIEALQNAKLELSDLGSLATKDSVNYSTEVTNKPTLGSLASLSSISYSSNYLTNKPTLGSLAALSSISYTSAYITNKPTLGGIQVRPNYTISSTDIGENATLANGTIYFVI